MRVMSNGRRYDIHALSQMKAADTEEAKAVQPIGLFASFCEPFPSKRHYVSESMVVVS